MATITKPRSAKALDAESRRRAVPKNAQQAREFHQQATANGNGKHPAAEAANSPLASSVGMDANPYDGDLPDTSFSHVQLHQIHVLEGANPRRKFDDSDLAELAESIQRHGILEPILCRYPEPGKYGVGVQYELVAGERRYRAALLAGLKATTVKVCRLSSEQADAIRLVENLQRVDLSPVETAQAMQGLLERHGWTQEQLATKLGKSAAHVSQTLPLARLTPKWQQALVDRTISPTHARALIPYVEHPKVLDLLAKEFLSTNGFSQPIGNHQEFAKEVGYTLEGLTRGFEKDDAGWNGKVGRTLPPPKKLTDEQREKLEIVTIDGKERALNVELWQQLQAKQGKARDDDQDAADSSKAKPKRTPAQQKALEKKQAEQFARRLKEWRSNWLRWILSIKVLDDPRLALAAVTLHLYGGRDERGLTMTRLEELVTGSDGPSVGFDSILARHPKPSELLVQLAADWLWYDYEPGPGFDDDQVEALAEAAAIDLDAEFRIRRCGPLLEAYFEMHNKAQLEALAKECGYGSLNGGTKAECLDELQIECTERDYLPKEITRVKTAAKAPKKAAAKVKPKAKAKGGRG